MKKYFKQLVIGFLLAAVLCMTTMYIIDPYQYFRQSTLYSPLFLIPQERNINPGLVKNFDYDSLIISNSTSENFTNKHLRNELKWNPLKICMSGSSSYEYSLIYDILKRENKDVKNIITTFDLFAYEKGPNEAAKETPLYLYNDKKLDDIRYLLNLNILFNGLENIYDYNHRFKDERFKDRDYAYFTGDLYEFSKNAVVQNELENLKSDTLDPLNNPKENTIDMDYINKVMDNFNNHLLKYINENPSTKFYIVFPPYSILYFKDLQYKGNFENFIYIKNRVSEELLNHKNVSILDFQTDEGIVKNLDNYKDIVHYTYTVNNYMEQNINNPDYILTPTNYNEKISHLKNMVEKYKP